MNCDIPVSPRSRSFKEHVRNQLVHSIESTIQVKIADIQVTIRESQVLKLSRGRLVSSQAVGMLDDEV